MEIHFSGSGYGMEVLAHPSVKHKGGLPFLEQNIQLFFKKKKYGKGLKKFWLILHKNLPNEPIKPVVSYDSKSKWVDYCMSLQSVEEQEFYLTCPVEDWHRHLVHRLLEGIQAAKALHLPDADLDALHADVLAFFQGNVLAPGYDHTAYAHVPPPVPEAPALPDGYVPQPLPTAEEIYDGMLPSGSPAPTPAGDALRAFVPDFAGLEDFYVEWYTSHVRPMAQTLARGVDLGLPPAQLAAAFRQGFDHFAREVGFYKNQDRVMPAWERLGRLAGLPDPLAVLDQLPPPGVERATALARLEALRAEKKYRRWWGRSRGYYMGLERITNGLVDAAAALLRTENPTVSALLALFDQHLGQVEAWRYKEFSFGDTEDREAVGECFTQVYEAVGLTSTRGLLTYRL
jgi:hypothetical protein